MINKLWPDIEIIEKIEDNLFGCTYKAKKESNELYIIKYFTFAKSKENIDKFIKYNLIKNINEFDIVAKNIIAQIKYLLKLIEKFNGKPYIVDCYDYKEVTLPNNLGIDFYIKMEYVESIEKYYENKNIKLGQFINIGVDVCNSLELCERNKLINGNLSPKTIYIGKDNHYKIDLLNIISNKNFKDYLAPEIILKNTKLYSSDIYSLGIIIYNMLTDLQIYKTERIAVNDRINGKSLNKINNLDNNFMKLLNKACQSEPKNRYEHSSEMKEDLKKLSYLKKSKKVIIGDYNPELITKNIFDDSKDIEERKIPKKKKFKYKKILYIISIVFIIILCIYIIYAFNKNCESGYINKFGKCVKGYYYCENGYILFDNNQCKKVLYSEDAKVNYYCDQGYELTNEGCLSNEKINATLNNVCPNGFELQENKCIKIEWTNKINNKCPSGTILKNNKCYLKIVSEPDLKYTCENGYILNENKCYKNDKKMPNIKYTCSRIYKLKGNKCYKYDIKKAMIHYENN